jgi:superfamily II DNA or RNA helicase
MPRLARRNRSARVWRGANVDPFRRYQQAVQSLGSDERDLIAIIALGEPLNISRFQELASAAGLRQSAARAHDTNSLRTLLETWTEHGLVRHDERHFACAPELRFPALRDAVRRGRLTFLTTTSSRAIFGDRDHGYYSTGFDRGQKKLFLARAALALVTREIEPLLEDLAREIGVDQVVQSLLPHPLFSSFEPSWYESLPPYFQKRWLELGLAFAEAAAHPLGPLYQYLTSRLDRLIDLPGVLVALAGIAIQRADFDVVKAIMALPLPELTGSLGAAMAMIGGRYDEAITLVPMPRKSLPQGGGLIAMLNLLALIRCGKAEELAYAQRLIAGGSRKTSYFRQSHRVLKQILAQATEPGLAAVGDLFHDGVGVDCCTPLMRLLWLTWFEPKSDVTKYLLASTENLVPFLRKQGLSWLAGECDVTRHLLRDRLADKTADKPGEHAIPGASPLIGMRAEKERWELTLEGLERLVPGANTSAPATRELDERLIWRVVPNQSSVEPYVQKRTSGGWSRGRKLAVKHLLAGAAPAMKLSAEDARVAVYAREEREIYAGYPTTRHYLAPEALTALIGHPRVYIGEEELPVDVVRGQVQLIARAEQDRLLVSVFPAEFTGAIQLVQERGRLVVYALDAEAEPLLKWVGRGLSFPLSAQPRVLEVLGRLAHLLPVQSFEPTSAPPVTGDPKPWLRLTPLANGLSVTLSIRPLGEHGPQVLPGHGAPTLLGRIDGEAAHAERDFARELELTSALLEHCPLLEQNQSAEYVYTLKDATDCLALISALRDLAVEVNVEWPQGNPMRLRGRASRRALRGGVRSAGDFFMATGSLEVDADLSLELDELLNLVSEGSGRFVRLSGGDYLEIEQDLRESLEAIAAARSESARRASGKRSLTGVPLSKSALSVLETLTASDSGFELDVDAQSYRKRLESAFERRFPLPRRLEAELRSYQEEGFRWLARLAEIELAACLADDMGLGKTVQILALLLHRAKLGPALVVTPTSVCDNWRAEILRFAPSLTVRWYVGSEREAELSELGAGQVVVTSYNLLQQDIQKLQNIEWSTAVLDEAQFIKNADSLRAQAACTLKARFRIAATGTPVENHVGDLFGLFQFLLPDLLGSRSAFGKRFPLDAGGEAGSGARRKLRRLLQPFILRRTKAQVLTELPGLTEVQRSVTLSPTEAAIYESLRQAALAKLFTEPKTTAGNGRKRSASSSAEAALDPRARFQILAEITRLRRLCCHPELVMPGTSAEASKLSSFLELVDELIEGGHRALVFSQFVDMLTLVRAALDARKVSYQYLDGSSATAQRKLAVDAFQAGEGDLFLISLRAGGFGLNLTGADYVIHLDPWWNPAVEAQATDRTHRIGQTRPVTVYRLIAANTIEERIIELHRSKRELADSLLEDADRAAKLSAEELRALLD